MKMKKIFILLFSLFFSFNTFAQQSYICVADSSSGFAFNKTTKKWYPTTFDVKNAKYVLSLKDRTWNWKEIGEEFSMTQCGEFDKNGYLSCDGMLRLMFNKKTLRFLLTYEIGYVNVGIIGTDGGDTPNMTIGKCSPM
jgi:hypothetical protein